MAAVRNKDGELLRVSHSTPAMRKHQASVLQLESKGRNKAEVMTAGVDMLRRHPRYSFRLASGVRGLAPTADSNRDYRQQFVGQAIHSPGGLGSSGPPLLLPMVSEFGHKPQSAANRLLVLREASRAAPG